MGDSSNPPPGDADRISSATTPAIAAAGVRKTFKLPHERYTTLRERARHPLSRQRFELLSALAGVSVEVPPGEFFGVVGKNGSGKSTLLRCLAGIYPADSGQIAVEGRLVPFIELGVGFNKEMTARENVMTNAVLFGLSRREAAARFDDIVAFAELERFVDQKLKNYSTGMAVRLAFSTSVHVDADVLLFDEVLAVGDTAFQEKCFRRFDRLREEGKTVVIVTHDMDMVRRLCDRAMLLHEGRAVAEGDAAHVAERYEALNAGWRPAPAAGPSAGPRALLASAVPPPGRRPRAIRGADVDAGGERLQAEVRRDGAQLGMGHRPPGGALRRDAGHLHRARPLQRRREPLPRQPAHVGRPLDVLRTGHGELRPEPLASGRTS